MKKQFEAYFQTLNNHDIDKTLGFYAEAFELHFSGSDFIIDKTAMKNILGWDKGVNGKVKYQNLEVDGNSITGLFTERNDFFRLIGIDELKSENTYVFSPSGLIIKQTYEMLPDQPSFQEKMQPAVEWARKNKPEELKEIYPHDQIQYSREMGRRWVVLLAEWRKVTGPA